MGGSPLRAKPIGATFEEVCALTNFLEILFCRSKNFILSLQSYIKNLCSTTHHSDTKQKILKRVVRAEKTLDNVTVNLKVLTP
tara:strand:+ start:379 stop:627 length:249 start_codon:yes stop_codon:yes gene_type:complete